MRRRGGWAMIKVDVLSGMREGAAKVRSCSAIISPNAMSCQIRQAVSATCTTECTPGRLNRKHTEHNTQATSPVGCCSKVWRYNNIYGFSAKYFACCSLTPALPWLASHKSPNPSVTPRQTIQTSLQHYVLDQTLHSLEKQGTPRHSS